MVPASRWAGRPSVTMSSEWATRKRSRSATRSGSPSKAASTLSAGDCSSAPRWHTRQAGSAGGRQPGSGAVRGAGVRSRQVDVTGTGCGTRVREPRSRTAEDEIRGAASIDVGAFRRLDDAEDDLDRRPGSGVRRRGRPCTPASPRPCSPCCSARSDRARPSCPPPKSDSSMPAKALPSSSRSTAGSSLWSSIVRLLVGHVPVGPKRSVRTRSGGRPSRTRALAATSTSAVGPQM